MSDDSNRVTRKLPGGSKIVETVEETTTEASGSTSTMHVEKKRKLMSGDLRSIFPVTKPKKVPTPEPTEPKGKKRATEPATEPEPVVPDPLSLNPNEQAIQDLEMTLGPDWREALQPEFSKGYYRSIRNFLVAESRKKSVVYPSTENIMSWSRLTPLEEVKIIIIGQDPYHGPNQAHGLSFSVMDPTPPPPSLVNIYKELKTSVPGFVPPKSGNLTALAEQGVLWLNTSLTVRRGEAGSHSKIGWQTFTRAVLQAVLSRPSHRGVVFILWGNHAAKAVEGLRIDPKKNLVLKGVHPSPLSASKGFFGCNHFNKANDWIKKNLGEEEKIDWKAICPK